MSGKNIEIGIQSAHIHLNVLHSLGAVNQNGYTMGMRGTDHFGNGIDSSQGIRHLRHSHQFGFFIDKRFVNRQIQIPAVVKRDHPQAGTLALAKQLPGNNIGVVLHLAYNDFIAGRNKLFTEGEGHQVDSLCSTPRENDFT